MSSQDVLRKIFGEDEYDVSYEVFLEDSNEVPSIPAENTFEADDEVFVEDSGDHAHNSNVADEVPSNLCDVANNSDNQFLLGSVFSSIEDLFEAYQEHARLKGFSVVKRTENDQYACMTCDKGGISSVGKSSKKIDCKAVLNVKKYIDGTCDISSIFTEHSHELDHAFLICMRSHKQLTVNMKRQLEANDIASLRPCKNVRICEVQSGGPLQLGCTPKDCRNYVDQRKRLRLGVGDAEVIRNMLARIQVKDPSLFHLMDIDSDGKLHNVLWIHPRSRAAYQEFHDVVSFDTTYRVNRYNMPFTLVVGVNHHGHSILLGCALLSHEAAESFKWIFSNWLAVMNGVHLTALQLTNAKAFEKL